MKSFIVLGTLLFWVGFGKAAMQVGLKANDPFSRMEAEVMNYAVAAIVYDCDTCSGGKYVGNLDAGEAIGYSDLDFQDGAEGFQISFSGWQPDEDTGVIFLHLDYLGSTPFASVTTYNTGGTLSFITFDEVFDTRPTGVHDLYLTFVSNSTGTTYVCNLDWFQFYRPSENDPFSRMEAEVMNYAVAAVVYDCSTCSGGKYVGNLDGGEAIGYSDLDFQDGADGFKISFSGWQPDEDTGVIFLHLDYLGSTPFASVTTYNTGGTLSFITFDEVFNTRLTGAHDLYFTFVSNSTSTTNVCNLDWFQFYKLDYSTTSMPAKH